MCDLNVHVTISRVEDECTNDAAITLAEAALMEEDECVSAAAMGGFLIRVGYSHTHSKDAGLADVLHQWSYHFFIFLKSVWSPLKSFKSV